MHMKNIIIITYIIVVFNQINWCNKNLCVKQTKMPCLSQKAQIAKIVLFLQKKTANRLYSTIDIQSYCFTSMKGWEDLFHFL